MTDIDDFIRNWLPGFRSMVRDCLVNDFSFDYSEATELVRKYNDAFDKMIDDNSTWHVAYRIYDDVRNDRNPSEFIEYVTLVDGAAKAIAEDRRIPDLKTRETEFCIRCNYPKYKHEPCTFC